MTEKQLTIILVETEAVVNSRPLVYVDEDINSSMVLTPLDFLSLHCKHIIPDIVDNSDSDYDAERKPTTVQQLLETWKWGQKCLSQFWTLWKNEYVELKRKGSKETTSSPDSMSPNWRSCTDKGQSTSWTLEGGQNFRIDHGKRPKN